jgi:hypothetical protein
MAIELQPFRNEGKAAVPSTCKRRSCSEVSSEKVKHRAECREQNETFAPLPSFLQGHISISQSVVKLSGSMNSPGQDPVIKIALPNRNL